MKSKYKTANLLKEIMWETGSLESAVKAKLLPDYTEDIFCKLLQTYNCMRANEQMRKNATNECLTILINIQNLLFPNNIEAYKAFIEQAYEEANIPVEKRSIYNIIKMLLNSMYDMDKISALPASWI